MIWVGILLILGVLLEGIVFIMFWICLYLIEWNVNCFDVGKFLGVKVLLFKLKLFFLVKDFILELVDFLIDVKKLLKVFVMILFFLL